MITEAGFTSQVIELARLHDWRTLHLRPARTSKGWRTPVQGDGKGFPDLFMIHTTGSAIAAELKVGKNRLTPEQEHWLAAFRRAGIPSYVWTPDDWDEIQRVLENPW